jgi:hypothetical protein
MMAVSMPLLPWSAAFDSAQSRAVAAYSLNRTGRPGHNFSGAHRLSMDVAAVRAVEWNTGHLVERQRA